MIHFHKLSAAAATFFMLSSVLSPVSFAATQASWNRDAKIDGIMTPGGGFGGVLPATGNPLGGAPSASTGSNSLPTDPTFNDQPNNDVQAEIDPILDTQVASILSGAEPVLVLSPHDSLHSSLEAELRRFEAFQADERYRFEQAEQAALSAFLANQTETDALFAQNQSAERTQFNQEQAGTLSDFVLGQNNESAAFQAQAQQSLNDFLAVQYQEQAAFHLIYDPAHDQLHADSQALLDARQNQFQADESDLLSAQQSAFQSFIAADPRPEQLDIDQAAERNTFYAQARIDHDAFHQSNDAALDAFQAAQDFSIAQFAANQAAERQAFDDLANADYADFYSNAASQLSAFQTQQMADDQAYLSALGVDLNNYEQRIDQSFGQALAAIGQLNTLYHEVEDATFQSQRTGDPGSDADLRAYLDLAHDNPVAARQLLVDQFVAGGFTTQEANAMITATETGGAEGYIAHLQAISYTGNPSLDAFIDMFLIQPERQRLAAEATEMHTILHSSDPLKDSFVHALLNYNRVGAAGETALNDSLRALLLRGSTDPIVVAAVNAGDFTSHTQGVHEVMAGMTQAAQTEADQQRSSFAAMTAAHDAFLANQQAQLASFTQQQANSEAAFLATAQAELAAFRTQQAADLAAHEARIQADNAAFHATYDPAHDAFHAAQAQAEADFLAAQQAAYDALHAQTDPLRDAFLAQQQAERDAFYATQAAADDALNTQIEAAHDAFHQTNDAALNALNDEHSQELQAFQSAQAQALADFNANAQAERAQLDAQLGTDLAAFDAQAQQALNDFQAQQAQELADFQSQQAAEAVNFDAGQVQAAQDFVQQQEQSHENFHAAEIQEVETETSVETEPSLETESMIADTPMPEMESIAPEAMEPSQEPVVEETAPQAEPPAANEPVA